MAQNDRTHNYQLWIVKSNIKKSQQIFTELATAVKASGTDHQPPENQELNMKISTVFSFDLFLIKQNGLY